MSSIAIINYNMGNLHSVSKALEHVAPDGTKVLLTSSADEILAADRVVFPGQGAARDCMNELNKAGLVKWFVKPLPVSLFWEFAWECKS
jgi:glutamine amidotransferase